MPKTSSISGSQVVPGSWQTARNAREDGGEAEDSQDGEDIEDSYDSGTARTGKE